MRRTLLAVDSARGHDRYRLGCDAGMGLASRTNLVTAGWSTCWYSSRPGQSHQASGARATGSSARRRREDSGQPRAKVLGALRRP